MVRRAVDSDPTDECRHLLHTAVRREILCALLLSTFCDGLQAVKIREEENAVRLAVN